MTTAHVWLIDWEQECCGPTRNVGDEIRMSVFYNDGKLVEQRHDYGNDLQGQPITARVEAILWRRATERAVDDVVTLIDDYEPGVSLESTDDRPDDSSASWAFVFAVDTDDPLPGTS